MGTEPSGQRGDRGGTLLLGVDEDGRLIGLEPDHATSRGPNADRFELFIRDLWRNRLGTNAATLPRLTRPTLRARLGAYLLYHRKRTEPQAARTA